jgi:hypothetical protein
MKLVNKKALSECRSRGHCEHCHRATDLQAAHIFSKGAGQVDHPWNLSCLCLFCHASSHGGNEPLHEQLMAYSAKRHDVLQDDIEGLVYLIRRLPKGQDHEACIRDFQVMARNRRAGLQGEAGKDGVRRPLPGVGQGDRLPGMEAYEGWTPF